MTEPSIDDITSTIEAIYAAALDDSRWTQALARVGGLVRAPSQPFYVHNVDRPWDLDASQILVSGAIDRTALERLFEYYLPRSTFWAEEIVRVASGVVVTPESIGRTKPYYSSELVQDFARPRGYYFSALSNLACPPHHIASLAFHRSPSLGPFDRHECRTLEVLIPHIYRALRTRQRLDDQERQRERLQQAFDRIDIAVMEVTEQGVTRWMNRSMEALLHAGVLLFSDGMLGAPDPDQSALLRRRMAQCARAHPSRTLQCVPAIAISRTNGPPLLTELMPLRLDGNTGERGVLVMISEPDRPQRTSACWLKQAFGLTPMETKIVVLLAAGRSLAEVADELEISQGNARNRLKTSYRKMDITSQRQLVWLLRRSSMISSE